MFQFFTHIDYRRPLSKPSSSAPIAVPNNHFRDVTNKTSRVPDVTSGVNNTTPGLSYSDVHITSPFEDESASTTSDSQSSVIHVNDSRRASLASNASSSLIGSAIGVSRDANMNSANRKSCPSPQPQTTVWQPHG